MSLYINVNNSTKWDVAESGICIGSGIRIHYNLSVLFDPKLRWSLHQKKALAMTTFWASQIGRLAKASSGVSTSGTKQLYNTVAIPRFSCGAEV